jgi:hypothetical protein
LGKSRVHQHLLVPADAPAGVLFGPFLAFFEPPIRKFGAIGGLSAVGIIVGFVGGLILVGVCLWYFGVGVGKTLRGTRDLIGTAIEKCREPEHGFCTMIWKGICDAHAHVCTKIDIRKGDQT